MNMKVGLVSVGLALIAIAILCLTQHSRQAKSALQEVSSLKVGSSSFVDAQRTARMIGAQPSDSCLPDECTWSKRISNESLPYYWRDSEEDFFVEIHVMNSLVTGRTFLYRSGLGMNAPFVKIEEQTNWRDSGRAVRLGFQSTPDMPAWRVYAKLTPDASRDDRAKLLAFNFSCLWKWHGCKTAQDLLPTVYKGK